MFMPQYGSMMHQCSDGRSEITACHDPIGMISDGLGKGGIFRCQGQFSHLEIVVIAAATGIVGITIGVAVVVGRIVGIVISVAVQSLNVEIAKSVSLSSTLHVG